MQYKNKNSPPFAVALYGTVYQSFHKTEQWWKKNCMIIFIDGKNSQHESFFLHIPDQFTIKNIKDDI